MREKRKKVLCGVHIISAYYIDLRVTILFVVFLKIIFSRVHNINAYYINFRVNTTLISFIYIFIYIYINY